MKRLDLSIVIPVYEAEQSIGQLVDALQSSEFLATLKWELILVDDYSKDLSFEIISAKSTQYSNIIGLSLHKNVGQHSATLAGIIEASGELLLTMDDDFEHPIDQIEVLMKQIQTTQADVVFGVPANHKKSLFRKGISRVMKKSAQIFSEGYGDGSAFRLIRKEIYSALKKHNTPFVFIDEILAWYTKNVIFLPIDFHSSNKISTYRPASLIRLYFNIIFTYSSFPAQFLTRVGIFGSFVSFGFGVFFIVKKIFFKTQMGFTSIVVSILFSVSLILFALGIIAQYIYRQNKLMNQHPQFSIKNRTDNGR